MPPIGLFFQVFEQTHVEEADGSFYKFELVGFKCVGTYVRNKKNQNQVCKQLVFLDWGVSAILGLNFQISYIIPLVHKFGLCKWKRKM